MIEITIVLWIAFAITCAIIAGSRGRSVAGWLLLGGLFGFFALIVVAILPSKAKHVDSEERVRCPSCAELILPMAKVCKHCGADVQRTKVEEKPLREIAERSEGQSMNDYIDAVVAEHGATRNGDLFRWNGADYRGFASLVDALRKQ